MRAIFTILGSMLVFQLSAQFKSIPQKPSNPGINPTTTHYPIKPLSRFSVSGQNGPAANQEAFKNFAKLNLDQRQAIPGPIIIRDESSGLPIFIEGEVKSLPELRNAPSSQRAATYLEHFKRELHIEAPAAEFVLIGQQKDDLQQTHMRFRQEYQGIEVFGAEVLLHEKNGKITLFNGRYFPTPKLNRVTPRLDVAAALAMAWQDLRQNEKVKTLSPAELEMVGPPVAKKQLVIYHSGPDQKLPKLCWYFELSPNVQSRWAYLVDAENGHVLKKYSLLCKLHHDLGDTASPPAHFHGHQGRNETFATAATDWVDGKTSAKATDLRGVIQTINTYQLGNTYYLLDASKDMFDPLASKLPKTPQGGILTLDARNKINADGSFEFYFFANTNNTWIDPTAVSAHYHAGLVYDYYRSKFGRKSINALGGTIRSFVNIPDEDGASLENAFWNGDAIFYGNGGKSFRGLARGLDVAGHEITHGVVQNTANLEYENESGALNESFADVFGAMIDRDDWKMGEDVVLTSAYPSGAMRDLSNPNNGGRSLNDRGWQPANYSERYTGTDDNGGVHINSGITNRAFFLFATQVGKELAEQVYYFALSNYLTRSSRFVDARLAIVRAAREKGGESAAKAAEAAFETVGIRVGAPTAPPPDLKFNPGTQFILGVKSDKTGIGIFDVNKNTILELAIPNGVFRKPVVSDDGSLVIYINGLKQLMYIELDWTNLKYNAETLNGSRIWENVALSNDGLRLATLVSERKDEIGVLDLTRETNNTKFFKLYNPTYTEGVTTGNVLGADAFEWDLSGQTVVYDAYNEVPINGFGTYNYWDMGFLNAWNKKTNTFGDGEIEKIFNGLEEGENVGSPSFSKNTPYILSFDYAVDSNGDGLLDNKDDYYVLTTNLETGDIGTVFEGSTIGFPNYSTKDDFVIFNALNNSGSPLIAIAPMKTDKITPNANASVFLPGYTWGTWFANGERVLTSTRGESWGEGKIKVFPNPFGSQTLLELNLEVSQNLSIEILDVYGRILKQFNLAAGAGKFQQQLNLQAYPAGTYLLRIRAGEKTATRKLVKW